ncbi:MAG: HEAT repeat domain-containing protein, partial [Candidatus Bathyarchaeia archaeon]
WLQSPNPFIQGAAVTPMLGFLIKANENKAVDFFEKSILSENIYVRREIANFGIFNPPWNKKFISLIEKLCADQDERVRSICAGSLSNLAQIHTNLIEYFSKWSRSNDGKVRETTAIAAGKSYLPGSTHILKIIKKLSTDENDKVKILLIEALTQPRFLRGKYYDDPIKQDSQNIIPIIERIILEVDNKARKQIALCFSFRKFNNILTKWLKSQQWQLRQVALMSIDSGFIAPFIRRKLLRDSVPAVREALAFSLRFNDGREGLIEEHITLLDELFKDNNFDVKFAAVSSALTYSSKKPEFAKNILGEFISQKPPLYYKILLGGVISIYFNESAEEEIDKFYLDLIISSQSEYFQVLIPSIMFVFPRKVSEKDCLKVLKKIFSASEWQTRALAIKYFGLAYSWIKDFKKPSISDSIVKKLCRDDNHTVRRELVESLSRIILVEPALKPKIWSLIYQLSKDKDWWVRVNVAMALGFPLIAGEGETILSKYSTEATNVLKELTNDNDWGVRISALLALTFLKGKWSKNLLEYFLKDKDSRVREWAKRIKGESITQKLIYEFYAEMLCRNLNQFKDEIEFIIISEHQIDVAESLIMPMLKFNIKRITALLKEWETNKDPFLREVSSHILEKIKRNMI